MTNKLSGPLAGFSTATLSIGLYAEHGYEGRARNCSGLYLTLAKIAAKRQPETGLFWVALDPPNDGPHVFAEVERK